MACRERSLRVWCSLLMLGVLLAGCGQSARGPYNSTGEAERDPARAESLYREAVAELDDDPAAAEALLRQVLGFDLYHGAAHNNLGVLLLEQGKLYDAAEEFEWARKLLPGNPEPRTNLAIVLTGAGKHQEAISAAKAALEVQPGDLHATKTLALIQIKEDLRDAQTKQLLEAIILRSNEQEWRGWADKQMNSLRDQP